MKIESEHQLITIKRSIEISADSNDIFLHQIGESHKYMNAFSTVQRLAATQRIVVLCVFLFLLSPHNSIAGQSHGIITFVP